MKTANRKNVLLGAGLLGISTLLGVASPTMAAPGDNTSSQNQNNRRDRDDDNDNRTSERRGNRPDTRDNNSTRPTPRPNYNGQNGQLNRPQIGRPSYQNNSNSARNDHRFDDRRNDNRKPDYRGNNDRFRDNNRNNRNNYGYGNNNYGSNGDFGNRSFTGVVTRVRSNESFDVRVNGSTFNVYTRSRLPRGLNQGDTVRVSGNRQDNNDIRNASVSVIRNR